MIVILYISTGLLITYGLAGIGILLYGQQVAKQDRSKISELEKKILEDKLKLRSGPFKISKVMKLARINDSFTKHRILSKPVTTGEK